MREYWQMTRTEIHSGRYDIKGYSKPGEHSLNLEIAHRAAIRRALREGKPVPKVVLADYPDLGEVQSCNA